MDYFWDQGTLRFIIAKEHILWLPPGWDLLLFWRNTQQGGCPDSGHSLWFKGQALCRGSLSSAP